MALQRAERPATPRKAPERRTAPSQRITRPTGTLQEFGGGREYPEAFSHDADQCPPHRWRLGEANGQAAVSGTCGKCGTIRDGFVLWLPDTISPLAEGNRRQHAAARKAKAR